MKTLRYNIFNQIHKGLRALLYDTALAVQHTDFLHEEAVGEVFQSIERMLWLFESHAHAESRVLFPLLNDFAPDIVLDFQQHQDTDRALSVEIHVMINAYTYSCTEVEKLDCGIRLQQALTGFVACSLQHMNKKEALVNEVLWHQYVDKDIVSIERMIITSLSPEKNEWYSRWMMRGLNNREIIRWLNRVRSSTGVIIFDKLCRIGGQELPIERWIDVREHVEDDTVAVH